MCCVSTLSYELLIVRGLCVRADWLDDNFDMFIHFFSLVANPKRTISTDTNLFGSVLEGVACLQSCCIVLLCDPKQGCIFEFYYENGTNACGFQLLSPNHKLEWRCTSRVKRQCSLPPRGNSLLEACCCGSIVVCKPKLTFGCLQTSWLDPSLLF